MSQNQSFVTGEIYHVYNRGASGQDIFLHENDYIRFQRTLFILNTHKRVEYKLTEQKSLKDIVHEPNEGLVKIHAYVLMKNHFHILIEQVSDGGISKFMSKLLTGYTMYVNRKYKRSGVLFQGLFKAKHIGDNQVYFDYLFSYIHLNPIKYIEPKWKEGIITDRKKVETFLSQYIYSSYLDYHHMIRDENIILDSEYKIFEGKYGIDVQKTIDDWVKICSIQKV